MAEVDPKRGERDTTRDVVPVVAATLVAWWTTVRPAGFFPGGTLLPKLAAGLAFLGIVAAAMVIVRRGRHLSWILLGGFVAPSALAWLLGQEAATALADPVEVFVGAIAWTTLGLVLIRPQAVAIPRGAEGGMGPTIGAGDDVARVAMKELDAALVREAPPKLTPRQPTPRLASLPLWVAAGLTGVVALAIVRVASNVPDRAVLARIAGAAVGIGLLSTAGDLVEVRYLGRKPPAPRTRLQRALTAFAALAFLTFLWFAWLGRDH